MNLYIYIDRVSVRVEVSIQKKFIIYHNSISISVGFIIYIYIFLLQKKEVFLVKRGKNHRMDSTHPPESPTRIVPKEECLLLIIGFFIFAGLFCWLFVKCCGCICQLLIAEVHEPVPVPVAVRPRMKIINIDQLMPPVMVHISSNEHEIASKHGGGGRGGCECCAICLGEFEDGELCRVFLKCNHEFHVPCIDAWLLRQNLSCPVCRNSLEDAADDLV